ncbi:hypothetical protein NQZ68_025816 [Dissostichus eleginoides]|nr:hypothetical protein NQZ68_025816 [Dissostichus eleginoides]
MDWQKCGDNVHTHTHPHVALNSWECLQCEWVLPHERDVLSQVGSECPGLLWQPRVGPGFGLLDKHSYSFCLLAGFWAKMTTTAGGHREEPSSTLKPEPLPQPPAA